MPCPYKKLADMGVGAWWFDLGGRATKASKSLIISKGLKMKNIYEEVVQ